MPNNENTTIPDPTGAPWQTSKLFFRADAPGQRALRTALRWATQRMGLSIGAATALTWAFLVASHGEDEQP